MSANSSIEWTHHTFNPWWGCAKVSPGCDHCYAERDAKRYQPGRALWGVDAERRTFGDKHWDEPLKWDRAAAKAGEQHRVFCASMADVFDKNAPTGARERLFALIEQTPHLAWLLLTKRIGNAKTMLPPNWLDDDMPPNVWLGISVVNQEEADRDIPKLLQMPARVRFLSCEPLLGAIDLTRLYGGITMNQAVDVLVDALRGRYAAAWGGRNTKLDLRASECRRIDWVIAGGESGPHARPMHPDWARSLRDQCQATGVPFLFKQWGEYMPAQPPKGSGLEELIERVGKKYAGRTLDGHTWNEFPA